MARKRQSGPGHLTDRLSSMRNLSILALYRDIASLACKDPVQPQMRREQCQSRPDPSLCLKVGKDELQGGVRQVLAAFRT